jgi:hypothetical protein
MKKKERGKAEYLIKQRPSTKLNGGGKAEKLKIEKGNMG